MTEFGDSVPKFYTEAAAVMVLHLQLPKNYLVSEQLRRQFPFVASC